MYFPPQYSSRAVLWFGCLLLSSGLQAAPTAVNDSYTTTEDTLLNVAGGGTTNLITADFEPGANQGDGFTVVKNPFGTSAPLTSGTTLVAGVPGGMAGSLVTTDKHGGTSSYYMDCGRDSAAAGNAPAKSVGIQASVTLASAATVRISYWYHMKVANMEWGGGNPIQYELGDHLLKVDSAYFGTAYTESPPTPSISNTAIRHVRGPQGASQGSNQTNDSLWLQVTQDVALTAGAHTITLGVYNNTTNNNNEHVEAWFDDVTVDTVNASGGILINDTGGATSAVKLTNPAHGTLSFNTNGNFTYTPAANYFGADSFTYQASDGTNLSNVATVSINVTGVNDAPVAVANSYNLTEDVPLTVNAATGVLANDTDVDGDSLTAVLVATTTKGTLSLNTNGSFTYTPNLNYNGTDSFTYQANDGNTNSATVTVTLNIAAVNDAPVGGPDSYTVNKNTALTISNPAGTPLVEDVILGTERAVDGKTIVTPGSEWKYYSASAAPADQGANTWTALAYDDSAWPSGVSELGYGDGNYGDGTPIAGAEGRPEGTIIPDNASAGYVLGEARWPTAYFRKTLNLTDVSHITAMSLQVLRDDGVEFNINGTPAFRSNLVANPTYTTLATSSTSAANENTFLDASVLGTTEGTNLLAAAPSHTLLVEGSNIFSAEVHQSATSSSDLSFDAKLSITRMTNFGLLLNDSDPEGQTFTAQVATNPLHGSVVVNSDGTFTYTPTTGYVGTDSFTYQAKDSLNALSSPITVTINVINTGGNSAPTAVADTYNATEDTTLTVPVATGVLVNDTDPDTDPFTAVVLTAPQKGTLTLNPDGSFEYIPNANANGTDSFTYRAHDLAYSQPATVTINIAAVNDAPVAVNESYGGDPGVTLTVNAASGVLANDTDVDGNTLTATLVTPPASGTLNLAANGAFTYTPTTTGTYTFTYRASDGVAQSNLATVTIILNGAPITLAESYNAVEDTTLTVPAATGVLNNDHDPEGQTLTAQLVAQGTKGVATLNANGGFSYVPYPNATGADIFTYQAFDGVRLSLVTNVTINIASVNDVPVATANTYAVPQNSTLDVTAANGVLGNDTDVDVQPLTALLDTNVAHGTLTLNPDGSFTYVPAANFSGPDAFYYHASDGTLSSEIVKVTLNVSDAADDIVINEIMSRPGTAYPENTDLEWIELYNRSGSSVDLSAWTISSGVGFTFPSGTTLTSHSYLVVAANAAAFHAAFPAVTNYIGGWVGTLSDTSEKLTLTDSINVNHDSVTYANAGDWSIRFRETTFNGWDWDAKTSGGGYTMELRNPLLSNNNGQNWQASAVVNGTPGQPNAALTANIQPIIKNMAHTPAVPTSSDIVVISCELDDETPFSGLRATLYWRNATTTTPPAFSSVVMSQDGLGKWFAPLPKQANNTIIEFYVSATDGTLTRTWPAATTEGQNANCQYQVSDEAVSTSADMYRMIMTATENAAYEANAAVNSSSNKVDTNFNQTLVITHGTDTTIRYRCSVRVRGNSSRSYQFKPLRVGIPSDDPLEGHTAFNLNPKASFLQYLGMRAFQAAGVRATDAIPIELRRNGVEYTTSSGSTPDYGRWVRLEDLSGDMVSAHWPEASTGGLYKKGRPDRYWRSDISAPTNPDTALDGWTKQNNSGQNDWSDMLGFFTVVQSNALPHFPGTVTVGDVAASGGATLSGNGLWNSTAYTTTELASIETVADLDQWARWLAVMTILQDKETNISNGEDDDYSMYFMPQTINGVLRKRMQIVTHDMDTIFGLGDAPTAYNGTNAFDATENGSVFRPLLPMLGTSTVAGNADFRNRYFTALRQLFGGQFNADTSTNPYPPFYAWIDNHLSGWAPAATITSMKTFATQRQAYLLGTGAGLVGAAAILPTSATSNATFTAAHGSLCISEVLAQNVSALNNSGTFPDVIELQNTGATAINLSGMSLTDDPLLKAKYTFPTGTTLAAGAFLTLYADATTTVAPGTHLGFSLDQDGDAVFIYDSLANGQGLVDSIVFGLQAPNLSIGRTGAGLTTWALCTPTPGAANTAVATLAAPGSLKINEWLSNSGTRFPDDFIELYNSSANPVALGGMALTDDFINYPGHGTMPPLSFMAGSSFQAFLAKGKAATPNNSRELDYTLNSAVGTIALLGANGALVDRVEIIAQFPDGSVGRTTDGGDNWNRLATASPGASNGALPANTQNLLNYLRITELMYSPQTTAQSEYIELRNVSDLAGNPVSLDLTGVYFANGVTFTFPSGTTLAAGAHLVLAGEPAKFTAQFPAVTVGGTFVGKLDNNGERVTLMLPNYNIAILDFRYNNTWHPTTDGQGSALSIVDPLGTPDKWDLAIGWEPTPPSPGASPAFSVYAGPDLSVPVNTPLYLDGSIIKGSLAANAITSGWSFVSGPSTPTFTTQNYQDANATFTTPGVYVLQFSATGGASTLTDNVTVVVTETYAAWAARTLTGGNTTQQGLQDDPDHDSVPNIIEWATGTNPAVSDFPFTIDPATIGGAFTIHYTRSKLIDPTVQIIPQFSTELENWLDTTNGSAVTAQKDSESGTLEHWSAESFLNTDRQFSRIQVVVP